jgi:hypothetical protein
MAFSRRRFLQGSALSTVGLMAEAVAYPPGSNRAENSRQLSKRPCEFAWSFKIGATGESFVVREWRLWSAQ